MSKVCGPCRASSMSGEGVRVDIVESMDESYGAWSQFKSRKHKQSIEIWSSGMSTSTQSIKKRNSRLPTGNTRPHRRLLNNRLGFSSFSFPTFIVADLLTFALGASRTATLCALFTPSLSLPPSPNPNMEASNPPLFSLTGLTLLDLSAGAFFFFKRLPRLPSSYRVIVAAFFKPGCARPRTGGVGSGTG